MSRAPLIALVLSFTFIAHGCGADTDGKPARSNDALGGKADAQRDAASAPSDSDPADAPPDHPEDAALPSDPPLNADPATGEVQEGRCPLYADIGCPEECAEFNASVADPVLACYFGVRLVDCIAPGYGAFPGEGGCYVPADGLLYLTPVSYRPAGPSRSCTEEEEALLKTSELPECE